MRVLFALTALSILSPTTFAGTEIQASVPGGNSIDIVQVNVDPNVTTGGDNFILTGSFDTAAQNQINILQYAENATDGNTFTVDQSAATAGSIANMGLNASLLGAGNAVGLGDSMTGVAGDLTQITQGASLNGVASSNTALSVDNSLSIIQSGDTHIANLAAEGSSNIASITQNNSHDIANMYVDGSNAQVSVTQSGATDVANIAITGDDNNVTVTQANDNAVLSMNLVATGDTITLNQ